MPDPLCGGASSALVLIRSLAAERRNQRPLRFSRRRQSDRHLRRDGRSLSPSHAVTLNAGRLPETPAGGSQRSLSPTDTDHSASGAVAAVDAITHAVPGVSYRCDRPQSCLRAARGRWLRGRQLFSEAGTANGTLIESIGRNRRDHQCPHHRHPPGRHGRSRPMSLSPASAAA